MAAIAGRVAIVPSGEYEHGRQYKRLDSVRYLGGVYMAKKDNVDEYPAYNDDNEYWMFMVGATDIADYEHPGIVMPDGKTITIDEDGTITGASTGFVGSTEAFEIAKEAGELVDGQLVFLDDDFAEGGGGKDEVYIGDTEPTDETSIWIKPDEDPDDIPAASVSFDGSKSGLQAGNVQEAVDEISEVTQGYATNMGYVTEGTMNWVKVGRICSVQFYGRLAFENIGAENAVVEIFTGLPEAISSSELILNVLDSGRNIRARVSTSGKFGINNYHGATEGHLYVFIGGTYITAE